VQTRLLTICVLLCSCASLSPLRAGTDATGGTMELKCIPPLALKINLVGFSEEKTLRFGFIGDNNGPAVRLRKHTPVSTGASSCTTSDVCENAGEATVI